MTEVINLVALRSLIPIDPLAYVKGHSTAGDGGEGFFLWREELQFSTGVYSIENNGTIIKSSVPEYVNKGSWIRQYDDYISVVFFGAFGMYADYTTEFQAAIEFAYINSKNDHKLEGSTIFVPNGEYFISNLLLRDGVSIVGESTVRTILYAVEGDDGQYMFDIDSGQIVINVSNLNLSGNDTNRGAFNFRAHQVGSERGGLWQSRLDNILAIGFRGHGINLEGGAATSCYQLPNQYNIFENVRIYNASENHNALRIIGQTGQLTFLNCEFNGSSFEKKDEYFFKKGKNVLIENRAEFLPAVISFINCTFQFADYAIHIAYCENITIDNCWFEQNGISILITSNKPCEECLYNPSRSINITNNRFVNAAGFGSLNAPENLKKGQVINVSNSFINVDNNFVGVTDPNGPYLQDCRFILAHNNIVGGVTVQNNNFQDYKLGLTHGIMQLINVDGDGSIDCYGHRLVFVYKSEIAIETIKSQINASEYLTIRAEDGSIVFKNTDNIFFIPTSGDSFTLGNGEIVTFIKIDNITGTAPNEHFECYQLVSIMRNVT
jgi:hypothetical protein